MSKSIKNALKTILDEFYHRYGVEVNIDVRVHNLIDSIERPTRELAERIVNELAEEIEGTNPRHAAYNEGEESVKVAWVETETDNIQITVFYPYTEYHQSTTEGNNERESGA